MNSGYRLVDLEVFNWGTFDGAIWHMALDGHGCLLTGENGTGKSTLIDAFLSLLVPNKRRSYNMSSGSERRERNETTYVRGAFQREKTRWDQIQVKYLRDEQSLSALAAHFANPLTKDRITLAQFFWFESSELRKCLVISHDAFSLKALLNTVKTPADLRYNLRQLPHTTIFSSFSEYQEYFVRYMGLRSSKGMDLFNQVSTIKQIGNLNEFVRQNMLEETDMESLTNEFFHTFEDLTLAHQAIINARLQIESLDGIDKQAQVTLYLAYRYGDCEVFSEWHNQDKTNLPLGFASNSESCIVYFRDFASENEAELLIKNEAGMTFIANKRVWTVNISALWQLIHALLRKGWEVWAEKHKLEELTSFGVSVESGIGWFELQSFDTNARQLIDPFQLIKYLKRKALFIQLGHDRICVLPEHWITHLTQFLDISQPVENKGWCFSSIFAPEVDAVIGDECGFQADDVFHATLKRMRSFDGETSDREHEIALFQSNKAIKVLLISLRVGGVGIDLTNTDVCIIADPWWNDAVEKQAIDRLHRFGQKKTVTVLRLISADSIEEKMDVLKRNKSVLADALGKTHPDFLANLKWDDFTEIF